MVGDQTIRIEEILRKIQEEVEKKTPEPVEEVEVVVIDVSMSRTGTLVNLYTMGTGVYVYDYDEIGERIVSMIAEGKIVKVKGKRLRKRRRLLEITSVEEVDINTLEVPVSRVVIGIIERYRGGYRVRTDNGVYYLAEETENYSKLEEAIGTSPKRVALLASEIEEREDQRGKRVVIRGFYLLYPPLRKEENKEKNQVDEKKIKVGEIVEEVEEKPEPTTTEQGAEATTEPEDSEDELPDEVMIE
ncbi:MAG: hypothetical protein QXM08_00475 [Thermofilaceae archaeon]